MGDGSNPPPVSRYQCYLTDAKPSDLPAAIRESEALRKRQKDWPPANSGDDPSRRGLAGVMDDEMGFVD